MKKPTSNAAKVRELEPADKHTIDVSKFKSELSANDINKLVGASVNRFVFPFLPIETLTCTKTKGLGRTNLTLIAPTIVQVDTPSPFASFDKRNQTRKPAVQMHFQASGYGITSFGTYIMEFAVQVFGQSTFNLVGNAGPGTVVNAGVKVLNGQVRVALIFQNVPPAQETFGFLEESSGVAWNWFSTQVRFPDIVIAI